MSFRCPAASLRTVPAAHSFYCSCPCSCLNTRLCWSEPHFWEEEVNFLTSDTLRLLEVLRRKKKITAYVLNSRELATTLIHEDTLGRAGVGMGSSSQPKTAMAYKHWRHVAKKGLKFHAYNTLTKGQGSLRFFSHAQNLFTAPLLRMLTPWDHGAHSLRSWHPVSKPVVSEFFFPQESLIVKQVGNLATCPSHGSSNTQEPWCFHLSNGIPSSYSMGTDSDSNCSWVRWRQPHGGESSNSTKATQRQGQSHISPHAD